MNAKISMFVNCSEAIIYLLLYNLHDCTFKAIVNLLSYEKKKILILFGNNHYITPYKKNCFFLNRYIFFYHNILVFISLERLKASSSF